jgi:hypothetical protein
MAARAGLANLITRWRRLVDDAASETWTDDEAQAFLDAHAETLTLVMLTPSPRLVDGETVYRIYRFPFRDVEEADSGDDYWRVYDSLGTTIAATAYTADSIQGTVTFTEDQEGETRYADLRRYDLNGAAADAWRERAAAKAGLYAFSSEGQSFQRQQWFEHCEAMARRFEAKAWAQIVDWGRGDARV